MKICLEKLNHIIFLFKCAKNNRKYHFGDFLFSMGEKMSVIRKVML